MSLEFPESYRRFLANFADYSGHGPTIPPRPESFAAATPAASQKPTDKDQLGGALGRAYSGRPGESVTRWRPAARRALGSKALAAARRPARINGAGNIAERRPQKGSEKKQRSQPEILDSIRTPLYDRARSVASLRLLYGFIVLLFDMNRNECTLSSESADRYG